MFPNLEAEMARGKITQSSIALSLGITPTTFSFKLNGKAPISLKECVKIKNTFSQTRHWTTYLQPNQTRRNQRKEVREVLDKIKFFLEDATIPIIGGIIGSFIGMGIAALLGML